MQLIQSALFAVNPKRQLCPRRFGSTNPSRRSSCGASICSLNSAASCLEMVDTFRVHPEAPPECIEGQSRRGLGEGEKDQALSALSPISGFSDSSDLRFLAPLLRNLSSEPSSHPPITPAFYAKVLDASAFLNTGVYCPADARRKRPPPAAQSRAGTAPGRNRGVLPPAHTRIPSARPRPGIEPHRCR
jgi:hypothetical protein